MKLSVCIPMYNESKIALDAAATYSAALDMITDGDYELIFCDDGSTDESADMIRRAGEENERIRLTGYPVNRGKGAAVRTAVMAASGDIILYTDCDNAYGTEKIKEALDALENAGDTDILIGSRNAGADGYEGYSFLRKLMSKTYILVLKLAAGFRMSDSQCGFKAFRREAAHEIFSKCETDSFAFDIEVLMFAAAMGYKIDELPVRIVNHRDSESKVHIIKDTVKMLRDLFKIKRRVRRMYKARTQTARG